MAQTVKEKRTLVRFAVQKTRYVAGNGAATEWETIKVNIGTTDDGKPITTDCFTSNGFRPTGRRLYNNSPTALSAPPACVCRTSKPFTTP